MNFSGYRDTLKMPTKCQYHMEFAEIITMNKCLSVTCDRLVIFSEYSGYLHQ